MPPRGDGSLKERQCLAREANRIGVVGRGDIDDAVLHLDVEWTDLVGVDDSEPTAFDHCRATHADARLRRRDDQVGAPEQCGVARETATRCDADARHDAGEPSPECERHDVKARDHGVIRVAGPAAAALGEEHDGQSRRSITSKSRSFFLCPITPWFPASTV